MKYRRFQLKLSIHFWMIASSVKLIRLRSRSVKRDLVMPASGCPPDVVDHVAPLKLVTEILNSPKKPQKTKSPIFIQK